MRGTTGIAIRELAGFGLYSKQIEVTAKTISAFWRCLRRWLWSLTFQSPEFLIKGPLGNILAFVWSKSNHFLARTRHDTQTNEPQTDRQTDRRTVPNGPCPKKQYLPCYRNQGLIIIGCTLLQSCDTARQYFCIRWNDYWREEYGWERNSQYQLYSFVQRWSSVYICAVSGWCQWPMFPLTSSWFILHDIACQLHDCFRLFAILVADLCVWFKSV